MLSGMRDDAWYLTSSKVRQQGMLILGAIVLSRVGHGYFLLYL